MKKVGLISLGCAKNLVDSENILGLLKKHYEIVNTTEDSDIIGVATKLSDILLNPFQSFNLVENTIVARYLVGTLLS